MAARRKESVEDRFDAAIAAVKSVPPRRMKDFLTTFAVTAPEFARTRRTITFLSAALGIALLALGGVGMVVTTTDFTRALAPMLFGSVFLAVAASMASGQPLTLKEVTDGLQSVITNTKGEADKDDG